MLKRLFDMLASFFGLILLSPIMVLVAILIKLDSHGGVFFSGQRVGKGEKLFSIFKFRTMVESPGGTGPLITAAGDTRVTRVGKILRKTKIDELPQLWNVLRGEMSLVGPRPEDPRYVKLYTAEQRRLLTVRPGITSPASVQYRNEEDLLAEMGLATYENLVMPMKLAADLDYLQCRSFLGDLKILLQTFFQVLRLNSETTFHGSTKSNTGIRHG